MRRAKGIGTAIAWYVWLISTAQAVEQVSIGTPVQGMVESPFVAAMRNRYYHSAGMEVRKIHMAPETGVKALLAGEVEFLLGWEGAVSAALQGAPVRLVAVTAAKPFHVFVARTEIGTMKNLKGKSVGIDRFGSSTDYFTRVALRYLGIDPERDVAVSEIGGSQARISALRAREIHATAVDAGLAGGLVAEGMRIVVPIGEIIDQPVFGIAVTMNKVAAERDKVKRFIQATLRGARFVKRNRADSLRMIQSYLKIPREQAARAWDATAEFFTDDGLVSERALAQAMRRALEGIESPVALNQPIADWSVIRELATERRNIPFWLRQYDP